MTEGETPSPSATPSAAPSDATLAPPPLYQCTQVQYTEALGTANLVCHKLHRIVLSILFNN